MSLNGEWEFAFDDNDQGVWETWKYALPVTAPNRIVVPFPYQSKLSGINDKSIHEIVWYSRTFDLPREWAGMNVLLHFGAVDYP